MQVAVIGRGIAGLTIAYRLLQRGCMPTLFGKSEFRASLAAQGLLCNKGLLFSYQPLFHAKLKSLSRVKRFLIDVEKTTGFRIEKNFDGVFEPYFSELDYHRIVKRVYKGQFTGLYRTKNLAPIEGLDNFFNASKGYLYYPEDGWYSAQDLLNVLEAYLVKSGVNIFAENIEHVKPNGKGGAIVKPFSLQSQTFHRVVIAAGTGTQRFLEDLGVNNIKFFYHPGQVLAIHQNALNGYSFVRRTYSMIGRDRIMLGSTTGKTLVPSFDIDLDGGRKLLWKALEDEFCLSKNFLDTLQQSAKEDLWGVRVRIHDRQPIIGCLGAFSSDLHPFYVCGGLYKNGLQLSEAMAEWVVDEMLGASLDELARAFHVSRFSEGNKGV